MLDEVMYGLTGRLVRFEILDNYLRATPSIKGVYSGHVVADGVRSKSGNIGVWVHLTEKSIVGKLGTQTLRVPEHQCFMYQFMRSTWIAVRESTEEERHRAIESLKAMEASKAKTCGRGRASNTKGKADANATCLDDPIVEFIELTYDAPSVRIVEPGARGSVAQQMRAISNVSTLEIVDAGPERCYQFINLYLYILSHRRQPFAGAMPATRWRRGLAHIFIFSCCIARLQRTRAHRGTRRCDHVGL